MTDYKFKPGDRVAFDCPDGSMGTGRVFMMDHILWVATHPHGDSGLIDSFKNLKIANAPLSPEGDNAPHD